MGNHRALVAAVLCACGGTPTAAHGPIASSLTDAADVAGVPADLIAAIADEERGLALPSVRLVDTSDAVQFAGRLELRRGKLDTLALGARLEGVSEEQLQSDVELGTRAGARVLAYLGATDDPATWRPALEAMSGLGERDAHDYASRVLARLRTGGVIHARGGESIAISAHPAITALDIAIVRDGLPGDIIWFDTSCDPSKCDPGRPLGNDSVDKIVIHDTEGGWDASVATLQFDGGKSVHYIVDADGSRVGQFRDEVDTTFHAGNFFYNETSIGIEHVGFASETYADGLYDTSRALVADIRSRWPNIALDRTHIIGHYQVPNGSLISQKSAPCTDTLDACENSDNYGGANNHRDPGFNWQWCQYMEKLGGSCTCNDAWTHWNCTTDLTEAVRCVDGNLEIAHCSSCTIEAIGQDDQCVEVVDDPPGPGAHLIVSEAGSDDTGGGGGGGCSTGGAGGLGLAVGLGLIAARRSRRAR